MSQGQPPATQCGGVTASGRPCRRKTVGGHCGQCQPQAVAAGTLASHAHQGNFAASAPPIGVARTRVNSDLIGRAFNGDEDAQADLQEELRERRLAAVPPPAPGAATTIVGDPDAQLPLRLRDPNEHLDLTADITTALTGRRRDAKAAQQRLDAHPDMRVAALTREVRDTVKSRTGRQAAAHAVALSLDRNAAITGHISAADGAGSPSCYTTARTAEDEMEAAVSIAHPREPTYDRPPVEDRDIMWPESQAAYEFAQRQRTVRELERPRVPQVAHGHYTVEGDRDQRATHLLLAHLMHPIQRP